MPSLLRNTRISRTAPYLVSVTGLTGALFTFMPLAASANPTVSSDRHTQRTIGEGHTETVEQRIATLHNALKITPEEEAKWTAVAQVMRDNDARMKALIAARATTPAGSMDAVDDLKTYERFTQAHLDGLKLLISSFETLYNTMPADQKHLADTIFHRFAHQHET